MDDQALPWAEPAWLGSLDSPYYNDSHRKLQAYARKFYDENVIPHMLEWEAKGDVPTWAREAYLKSGLALLDVPREYRPANSNNNNNGLADIIAPEDMDIFHRVILTDEASRIEGGVSTALAGGANIIGLPPILNHGTDAQKKRWLPGLFDGKVSFCLGITEPSGGSDVSNIKTTAVKQEEKSYYYIVNGTKKWITGSPWATHMTTAVRTGGSGISGISLLVIPLSSPGISVEKIMNSGQNAGGASWVRMHDVKVPVDHLIGKENAGFGYIMRNFNSERFVLAIGCNRKARTCLTTALTYAYDRETFGVPLVSHQVIRHKLVHLAREVEAHWARVEQVAYHVQRRGGWQQQQADDIAGPIAMLKISGGRILEMAAREAQQVMGGVAYQRDGPGGGGRVEQITRDLRMMVVGGGSEEILGDLAFREEVKTAKRKAKEREKERAKANL